MIPKNNIDSGFFDFLYGYDSTDYDFEVPVYNYTDLKELYIFFTSKEKILSKYKYNLKLSLKNRKDWINTLASIAANTWNKDVDFVLYAVKLFDLHIYLSKPEEIKSIYNIVVECLRKTEAHFKKYPKPIYNTLDISQSKSTIVNTNLILKILIKHFKINDKNFILISEYITILSIYDDRLFDVKPSLIGCCIFLTCIGIVYQDKVWSIEDKYNVFIINKTSAKELYKVHWTKHMELFSGYSYDDLSKCMDIIHDIKDLDIDAYFEVDISRKLFGMSFSELIKNVGIITLSSLF